MMDFVKTAVEWLTTNWEAVAAVFAGAHALALAIVNLTPTPRDDEILGRVYRVVEMVAGLFTDTVKTLPGETTEEVKMTKALPRDEG